MREVKASTQDMAELVVETGPRDREGSSTEIGAGLELGTSFMLARSGCEQAQSFGEHADTFKCDRGCNGVATGRPKGFHAVSE
jgi:hypothetical protein